MRAGKRETKYNLHEFMTYEAENQEEYHNTNVTVGCFCRLDKQGGLVQILMRLMYKRQGKRETLAVGRQYNQGNTAVGRQNRAD